MPIWSKINATWITDLLYVTIDHYLFSHYLWALGVHKLKKTVLFPFFSYQFEKHACNVQACQEGSLHLVWETRQLIQDIFYKSKTSSRLPNFDTSNTLAIGPQRPSRFFSWARTALILDFAAWIDNLIMVSYQPPFKFQNTFCFFKGAVWQRFCRFRSILC